MAILRFDYYHKYCYEEINRGWCFVNIVDRFIILLRGDRFCHPIADLRCSGWRCRQTQLSYIKVLCVTVLAGVSNVICLLQCLWNVPSGTAGLYDRCWRIKDASISPIYYFSRKEDNLQKTGKRLASSGIWFRYTFEGNYLTVHQDILIGSGIWFWS